MHLTCYNECVGLSKLNSNTEFDDVCEIDLELDEVRRLADSPERR